jgi:hypothetical protein
LLAAYRQAVVRPRLHLAALALAVVSLVATIAHYSGTVPGNPLTWAAWLPAVGGYIASFRITTRLPSGGVAGFLRSEPGIALLLLVVYAVTHLWNYPTAPWNNNGLFDDAAWDVYFARNHAFSGPFQAAFFDDVGIISRETIFHYYIAVFFRLFGANLQVFNAALLVLGYVTVLFTTLVAHRLFRTWLITVLAALMINFLPLHYLHVFVGHRYAIAAPLMMAALYFAYSGFLDRSFARVATSGLFAALCFGSAIMGKQFILALAAAALLVPVLERRRWRKGETRALALNWAIGFGISAIPLLVYIAFNRTDYFRRDQGLLSDFLGAFAAQGYAGVRSYFDQILELFFAPDTFSRLWLHDFPLVPIAYWVLLIPGFALALIRRRIELVLLGVIPVGSAFLAGAADFRVLLAAPIWIVLMCYTLDALGAGRWTRPATGRSWVAGGAAASVLAIALVAAGVLPSATYLWRVSQDPHAQYQFRHRDVAVARVIQDVVAGTSNPDPGMKPNEFDRTATRASAGRDALACTESAYAVAHLYLQPFDDEAILAFCDGGNQALLGPEGVLPANVKALSSYEPGDKDLLLIWEESPTSQAAIDAFSEFERFGSARTVDGSVDGQQFRVRILTVPAERVVPFREAVLAAHPIPAP